MILIKSVFFRYLSHRKKIKAVSEAIHALYTNISGFKNTLHIRLFETIHAKKEQFKAVFEFLLFCDTI